MGKNEITILLVHTWGDVEQFSDKLSKIIQQTKRDSNGHFRISPMFSMVKFSSMAQFENELKASRSETVYAYVLFGTRQSVEGYKERIMRILESYDITKSFIFFYEEFYGACGDKMGQLMDFLWDICEPEEENE